MAARGPILHCYAVCEGLTHQVPEGADVVILFVGQLASKNWAEFFSNVCTKALFVFYTKECRPLHRGFFIGFYDITTLLHGNAKVNSFSDTNVHRYAPGYII